MLMVDLGSLEWFIRYMRLRDSGVVPTVTPFEFLPSQCAMAAFWGPKASNGWTFSNHGNPLNENYVRQLMMRVLQIQWPISGILPFHFARALMAKSLGIDVSWTEFACRQTHPHQSHTRIPRILLKFADLNSPLLRLHVILPNILIKVSHSLEVHVVRVIG